MSGGYFGDDFFDLLEVPLVVVIDLFIIVFFVEEEEEIEGVEFEDLLFVGLVDGGF
jgi:hypothetical protein